MNDNLNNENVNNLSNNTVSSVNIENVADNSIETLDNNVGSDVKISDKKSISDKTKMLIIFIIIGLVVAAILVGVIIVVSKPLLESSRERKFVKNVIEYADGTKSLWDSGKLSCGEVSSSNLKDGYYYVPVDTSKDSKLKLVDGD